MDETKSKPVAYQYEGSSITFSKGKNVMVNATQMAKKFGKRTADWLENSYTKEFISALSEAGKGVSADLVRVIKGGDPSLQGTWMHEDVALEFARWLSPKFAIWCNDRIKELLTTGVATATNDDAMILQAINVLQKRVAESKQQIAALQSESQQQKQIIADQQPYVDFAKTAFNADTLIDIGQAAKILNLPFGRNTLFRKLRADGIFFTTRNEPKQHYVEAKYFILTQLDPITTNSGRIIIPIKVLCTQKGLAYLNYLYGTRQNSLPAHQQAASVC